MEAVIDMDKDRPPEGTIAGERDDVWPEFQEPETRLHRVARGGRCVGALEMVAG
jgi:hypothetical protein